MITIQPDTSKPNGAAQMLVVMEATNGLSALVLRAAAQLSSASTAAEILEAMGSASLTYDIAKKAARFATAKGAYDEVVSKAYRAQADALEIEAAAKRRLADEYDAAQDRGEVHKHGGQGKRDVPDQNIPPATVEDIGLTRKVVHDARLVRDAEEADPGIVRRTLDEKLEAGEEPTKAAVNAAIKKAARPKKPKAAAQPQTEPNMEATEQAGEAAVVRRGVKLGLAEGADLEETVRQGMARDRDGENAEVIAKSIGIGTDYYRTAADILFLSDRGGYSPSDAAIVARAVRHMLDTHRILEAWDIIAPVAVKVWGRPGSTGHYGRTRYNREEPRLNQYDHAFSIIMQSCASAAELDLPYLSEDAVKQSSKSITEARRHLLTLQQRIKRIHE